MRIYQRMIRPVMSYPEELEGALRKRYEHLWNGLEMLIFEEKYKELDPKT